MVSKSEVLEKIKNFFDKEFSHEGARKMKKLAMSRTIKLGKLRAKFCKKCYGDLRDAKVRVTKTHRLLICKKCGFMNKIKN